MSYTINIEPGQNILDICLQELGSLSDIVLLHDVNGFDQLPADLSPGDSIIIPDATVNKELVSSLQKNKPATESDENEQIGMLDYTKLNIVTENKTIVLVEPGQNIFDICLQETGSLDNLLELHRINGLEQLPADIKAGDELIIPEVEKNINIVGILSRKKPATVDDVVIENITQGGIGYMGIEIDFVVS
jgi:hypothetical protein